MSYHCGWHTTCAHQIYEGGKEGKRKRGVGREKAWVTFTRLTSVQGVICILICKVETDDNAHFPGLLRELYEIVNEMLFYKMNSILIQGRLQKAL